MIEDQIANLACAFKEFIKLRMEEEVEILLLQGNRDASHFEIQRQVDRKYEDVLKYLE